MAWYSLNRVRRVIESNSPAARGPKGHTTRRRYNVAVAERSGRAGMRRPPTDLEILKEIHRAYASEYANYDEQKPTRSSKAFVPVDPLAIKDIQIIETIKDGASIYRTQ